MSSTVMVTTPDFLLLADNGSLIPSPVVSSISKIKYRVTRVEIGVKIVPTFMEMIFIKLSSVRFMNGMYLVVS